MDFVAVGVDAVQAKVKLPSSADVHWSPEGAVGAAYAATDVSKPKPNADTATSAMRLRSVFVDIIFLSLVRSRLS